MRYLRERQEHLRLMGIKEAVYLIPRFDQGKEAVYSLNHFRKLKDQLKATTGIDFRVKDFRSTFASLTVKKNPTLMLDVSKQLGHSSLEVTQRFYADIDAADAGKRLCDAWTDRKSISAKNVLIEQEQYKFGYAG